MHNSENPELLSEEEARRLLLKLRHIFLDGFLYKLLYCIYTVKSSRNSIMEERVIFVFVFGSLFLGLQSIVVGKICPWEHAVEHPGWPASRKSSGNQGQAYPERPTHLPNVSQLSRIVPTGGNLGFKAWACLGYFRFRPQQMHSNIDLTDLPWVSICVFPIAVVSSVCSPTLNTHIEPPLQMHVHLASL